MVAILALLFLLFLLILVLFLLLVFLVAVFAASAAAGPRAVLGLVRGEDRGTRLVLAPPNGCLQCRHRLGQVSFSVSSREERVAAHASFWGFEEPIEGPDGFTCACWPLEVVLVTSG